MIAFVAKWIRRRRRRPDAVDRLAGFDADFYRDRNADVRTAGFDPLRHFLEYGWRENRDPSAGFSLSAYLEANPDVADAGVNPLLHFNERGLVEGRRLRPEPAVPTTAPSGGAPPPPPNKTPTGSFEGLDTAARLAAFHRARPDRAGWLV